MRSVTASGWVRFGLPGLMLGLALGVEGRGPSALAQNAGTLPAEKGRGGGGAEPAGAGNGTIAFTTTSGGPAQWLYLIDTRAKAFAIYRVDPSNEKGAVKLEAARQYQWDLKLSEYNNQEPNVAAIESTVNRLGHPNR